MLHHQFFQASHLFVDGASSNDAERVRDLDGEVVLLRILIRDTENVLATVKRLKLMGVKLSIDDFGTGYSSLAYLKKFPISTLKIDRSFVHDMLEDPDDLAIVDGIVGLANAFRRQVIAEGVETVEHGSMLIHLGCDQGQGYCIARPMPADANAPRPTHFIGCAPERVKCAFSGKRALAALPYLTAKKAAAALWSNCCGRKNSAVGTC